MNASSRRSRAPLPLIALEVLTLALAWLLFLRFPIARAALVIVAGVPALVVAIVKLWLTRRPAMASKPSVSNQLHSLHLW